MKRSVVSAFVCAVFCVVLTGGVVWAEDVDVKEIADESIQNIQKTITILKQHKADLMASAEQLAKQIRLLEATEAYLVQKTTPPAGFWEQYKLMGWQLNIVLLCVLVVWLGFRLKNKEE